MIITNISSQTIDLSFIPAVIASGEQIEVSDSFITHPQLVALLNAATPLIQASNLSTATSVDSQLANLPSNSQKAGLDASTSPGSSNPYVTNSILNRNLSQHAQDPQAHHSNANDPSTNEKEAMRNAANPSGTNPFGTSSFVGSQITDSLADHVANFDHTPTPLTPDEVDAIQNGAAPTGSNPFGTASFIASQISSELSTHSSNATAHHTNVNDPTSDQKAALDAAAAPSGTNAFSTANDLSSHEGNATAHHSNANDPTFSQKAALDAGSSPSGTNPYITQTAQTSAINNAISTHESDVVAHHSNVNDPTADQKAALDGSETPSGTNVLITTSAQTTAINSAISTHTADAVAHHSNANDPTTAQKAALDAANTPSATNAFSTADDLTTHTANATAHHSNANDPTADQKAALDASASPSGTNQFITESAQTSAIATHAGIATAHHDNSNDPSSDEKGALAGTDGVPSSTNKYVTNSDPRNSDARTPLAHATSHTDGTDDIQLASPSQKGLMASADKASLNELIQNRDDVRLTWNSVTQLDLEGIRSKEIHINGLIEDISTTRSVLTTDNTIDATGADTTLAPAASTLHYVYASNANASPFPSDVRLSTVAPTFDPANNKYMLGTSGNSQNWALVGWVQTDAVPEFPDALAVASEFNELPKIANIQGSGTVGPAGTNDVFELITGLSQKVLLPQDWILEIHGSIPLTATNIGTDLDLGIAQDAAVQKVNTAQVDAGGSNEALAGSQLYVGTTSAPSYSEYSLQHAYSDVTGSVADASQGNLSIIRRK